MVLQNRDSIVISGNDFKILKIKKYIGGIAINEPICVINLKDNYWGSGIMYTLYSTEILSHAYIKADIAKMVKENLSGISVINMKTVIKNLDEVVK